MTSYRKLAIMIMALLILLLSPHLFPKSKKAKKETASKSESIFKVPIDIIILNVTATDKAGNPVTDLVANDFKVYDNGKPQNIQTFALESFGPAETEEPEIKAASPQLKAKLNSPDRGLKERSLPRQKIDGKDPSGRMEIKPNATLPRLISIFIDDLTMYTGSDFPRMFDDIKKFVQEDISPMDQVCIISGSGQVQFPFSNNKQQILDGLTMASRKLNYLPIFRFSDMTDTMAFILGHYDWEPNSSWKETYGYLIKIPEDAIERERRKNSLPPSVAANETASLKLLADAIAQNALVELQTHRLLQMLRQHIRALRHFEGAKTIMFFSDGFFPYPSVIYPFQEIVDMALNSGIVLNTSNIQGVPPPKFLDASRNFYQGGDIVGGVQTAWQLDRDWMADIGEQDYPLAQMAYETGGQFFHYSNDMHKQLQKIVRSRSYYYIMSYGMPSQIADGSYHRIRLEVIRPDVKLYYRNGYFTLKEELISESSRKEDIIEALYGPGNMNQIPMTLEYNYFQEDDSTYAVSFITDVNIRKINFVEEEARSRNQIRLVLAAFDETDHYISGLQKTIDFRLQEKSYAALRSHGLTSRVELKLPIGRYKIKAVVRESTQGKMGSITKEVEIP